MQQAAAQLADSIVKATSVLHNAASTPQQRAEAVQFFEQLKHGEIHSTVYAAAVLTGNEYALEVQMSAYTLLQILVRNRWAELSAEEHQKITQLAYQHMKDEGPLQAEISCLVLQFLSEDITQFEDRSGDWKRNYLSALLASVEDSFQAGSSAAAAGQSETTRAHAAVVAAALGTLGGFVEWAPLGRVCLSNVIEACSFFLNIPDFRDPALAVVKQIVGRKPGRDPEEQDAYAALMSKVADALCGAAAALLANPAVQQELGAEGSSEEYGRRFCSVVAAFADVHWHVVGSVQKQHLLLRQGPNRREGSDRLDL
eukprot:gene9038-9209_t